MAMPTELRDGLGPEQTEALDRTAMNGGRVVTNRDLYDRLDDQAVRDPESFAGVDLTQYRLSLGDGDYDRLTKLQQSLAEGKPDPAFERHRLGRLFLEEGLRDSNFDPNGPEGRAARQKFDRLSGAFEAVEGKPPTMADIGRLVGDVLPRAESDPNIVRVSGDQPAEADGNTQIGPLQGSVEPDGNTEIAPAQEPEAKDVLDGAEPRIVHNDDGSAGIGEAFDPQNIILAQAGGGGARGGAPPPSRPPTVAGQRPAPGIGHNRSSEGVPPGLPQAIENWRRWFPPSSQPSGTQPIPDTAGPAAAAEFAQAVDDWLSKKAQGADKDNYPGADGIDTAVGIKLDPRVGEPAAGRDYFPDNESHRKGLRGEYGLANDIARQFPDHTIADFGRKAGQREPDVVSVNHDGEVTLWDSKWRGSDTSVGPGGRAHQTDQSFENARNHARDSIKAAVKSGRLSPEAGAKAVKNLNDRNVTIVTVGTGSARNGVIERIVGGERTVIPSKRRP
jgi:hypothetical protein